MRFLLAFIFFSSSLMAGEFKYLARSPQALLMGDAFTTLATGPYTLFYNPALAARNSLFAFYPLPLSGGVTDPLAYEDLSDELDTTDTATFANTLIGRPLHLSGGVHPTIKVGPITFTPFASTSADVIIFDRVHPVVDIDYRVDRGFATGVAKDFKNGNGSWAVGVGAKYISREAIDGKFDVFGKTFSDVISGGDTDIDTIKDALGVTKGKGWGFDFGIDYRYTKGPGTFAMGLSVLDIADTKLTLQEGTGSVPDQEMSVNFGTSFNFDTPIFSWTVSADVHPINSSQDELQKIHLGARVGIPLIDLMVGYNGGYVSYGAGVRLWPFRLAVGFYDKEVGVEAGDLKSDRIVAYISLLDFTIDMP